MYHTTHYNEAILAHGDIPYRTFMQSIAIVTGSFHKILSPKCHQNVTSTNKRAQLSRFCENIDIEYYGAHTLSAMCVFLLNASHTPSKQMPECNDCQRLHWHLLRLRTATVAQSTLVPPRHARWVLLKRILCCWFSLHNDPFNIAHHNVGDAFCWKGHSAVDSNCTINLLA